LDGALVGDSPQSGELLLKPDHCGLGGQESAISIQVALLLSQMHDFLVRLFDVISDWECQIRLSVRSLRASRRRPARVARHMKMAEELASSTISISATKNHVTRHHRKTTNAKCQILIRTSQQRYYSRRLGR